MGPDSNVRGDLVPPGLGYSLPPGGANPGPLLVFPGPGQLHITPPQAENCE